MTNIHHNDRYLRLFVFKFYMDKIMRHNNIKIDNAVCLQEFSV